jgi:ADP-heptose:LPS heptosyltransferase
MLSYRQKILLDRTIGVCLALAMDVIARLIGIILRLDHTVPKDPRNIIVAKFMGIGSVLYTGILCRALKDRFPNSSVVYLTTAGCGEIAKRLRYVDQVITVDDSGAIKLFLTSLLAIAKVWSVRPVLYFDMEIYSSWAAIMATLSLARNRYGFYRKSVAFKKGLHNFLVFFNTRRHISEIYLQMAHLVGAAGNNDLSGLLQIKQDDRIECENFLITQGINDRPLIVINPNASELLLERRWPKENWIEYLEKVTENLGSFQYVLVGAPQETGYVGKIWYGLSPRAKAIVKNASGFLTLGAFLALIEMSQLIITVDSGPLHLAIAIKTPTVSLWGPVDPEHYGYMNRNNKVLYDPPYCSPCLHHSDVTPCKGDNICMKRISVESVFKATSEILS